MSPQSRSFSQVVRELGPRRFEVRDRYRAEYTLVEREDLGGVSLVQRADPDFFYRNDGGGRFVREPIARNPRFLDEAGRQLAAEPESFGLAAMFADLDGDGAPDLYVANDFEDPDQFWRNDGSGNFRLAPWYTMRSTSNSTMAVDVGDVNRDGHPDLFQVDMLSRDTRRLRTQIATHTSVVNAAGIPAVIRIAKIVTTDFRAFDVGTPRLMRWPVSQPPTRFPRSAVTNGIHAVMPIFARSKPWTLFRYCGNQKM